MTSTSVLNYSSRGSEILTMVLSITVVCEGMNVLTGQLIFQFSIVYSLTTYIFMRLVYIYKIYDIHEVTRKIIVELT